MSATLQLTGEPETVTWPESHFVFVERVGNIPQNAPQAWKKMEALIPQIVAKNQMIGSAALYKPTEGIYRAGFLLAAPPVDLPEGVQYEKLSSGKYARLVLTGPYDQLPEATGRAFAIMAEKKVALRDGFNIEHYVTDPRITPQEESITEILFPAA